MNVNLQYQAKSFESEEKRFYIPGAILSWECRSCGEDCVRDLGNHYLSYPAFNATERVHLCCPECDYDDDAVDVRLELQLSVVGDTLLGDLDAFQQWMEEFNEQHPG